MEDEDEGGWEVMKKNAKKPQNKEAIAETKAARQDLANYLDEF